MQVRRCLSTTIHRVRLQYAAKSRFFSATIGSAWDERVLSWPITVRTQHLAEPGAWALIADCSFPRMKRHGGVRRSRKEGE
jgi:hypothetical protein